MKARFVFACAAAGIALSAFGATTASAEGDFKGTIGFMPDAARPGESVDIIGTCDDPNFTTAPVTSDILDAPDLTGTDDGNGGWHLTSFATVRKDAKPGMWPVSFQCGPEGNVVMGKFEVLPAEPLPRAEITVDPQKGLPGAKVNITVVCSEPATVTSPALKVGKLEPLPKKDGNHPLLGAVGIVQNVKPGVYDVATNCGAAEITTKFTVLGAAPAPEKKAQVPVKPKGAANTGSLDGAPAPEDDTGLFVVGGAALAALGAAGGVGALAYRRRQRA